MIADAVSRELRGSAIALVMVAATTLVVYALTYYLDVRRGSVIYLLPVLLAGWHLGLIPALVAAVAGVLWSGYFFFSPYYSFYLSRPNEILNLLLFMVVAIVTSHLANSMKQQTEIARKREKETSDLYAFSRRLASVSSAADIYRAIEEHLASLVQRNEVLSDAAATLERLDVARALNDARMRSETELLREALIGSVSHELRTPLASILGAATVLTKSAAIAKDERLNSLAGVVRDESERLNNDIQNLLDATRISREQVRPRQEWIEPQDIINSALDRRRRRLSGHDLALDVDANLPFVYVDPVLVEQAFVQMVDNAAK